MAREIKYIDLNTAEVDDLVQAEVAQLDRERASEIVAERDANGPFENWADVGRRVPDMSVGMVKDMREAGISLGPAESAMDEEVDAGD